jgi:hypothetical protein
LTRIASRRWFSVLLATTLLAMSRTVSAQGYPFSQRSRMQQDVALTSVEVTYGRPVARGRKLFGALVPWDSIWHPGADSATRIVFSRDVVLEGKPVKAGEYSVWLLPRERPAVDIRPESRGAHVSHSLPGIGQGCASSRCETRNGFTYGNARDLFPLRDSR